MNERERKTLRKLSWIADLTPGNCPGGLPGSDAEWRQLVNKLLKRQITFQEQTFLDEGGFTERLYRARTAQRTPRTGTNA